MNTTTPDLERRIQTLRAFDDPAAIAEHLEAESVVGEPDMAHACPIAVWLTASPDCLHVEANYHNIECTDADQATHLYASTEVIDSFMELFDQGAYPKLLKTKEAE